MSSTFVPTTYRLIEQRRERAHVRVLRAGFTSFRSLSNSEAEYYLQSGSGERRTVYELEGRPNSRLLVFTEEQTRGLCHAYFFFLEQ